MADHETIWLQPWCADCARHEDRLWCQDNVWEEGCEECGAMPVKYKIDAAYDTAAVQPKGIA